MTKSGSIVEILDHRKRLKRSITQPRFGTAASFFNVRLEVRVEIDGLASRLDEMRNWLTEHGSRQQVFHCVRVGDGAVIGVDFDDDTLIDPFRQRFGGQRFGARG
jgi:hypothetical protein